MTDGYYNYKMDLWGVGCVFFEVLALFPLFPGENELDQVHKIHKILGTPSRAVIESFMQKASHMEFNFEAMDGTGIDRLIPHVTPLGRDLICKLLAYETDKRLTAKQALRHPYFKTLRDLERPSKSISPYLFSTGPRRPRLPPLRGNENASKTVQDKGKSGKSLPKSLYDVSKIYAKNKKNPFKNML